MKRDAGDLTGQRFGRLKVVLLYAHRDIRGSKQWYCSCDCGLFTYKTTSQLRDRNNTNKSCGCARDDSIKKASEAAWAVTTKFGHPLKLKIKWLYRNMLARCTDPANKRYADYGGRGISVCDEWMSDRYSFYRWCVTNGIQSHLQIDRKDNDGPYSPANCKFSTQTAQANNTRKNVFLTRHGRTLTVAQWAMELGVRPGAITHRIRRGWSEDRIFSQPYRRSRCS